MNLFKNVEDQSHVAKLDALRKNVAFAQRLVNDLKSAFDVQVEERRTKETTMQVVAYAPSQFRRYGWGFTFEATADGVSFEDGRGVWLNVIAEIVNAKVNTKKDYGDDKKANDNILQKAGEEIDVKITRHHDSACGDHFTMKCMLSETDPKLNAKLKLIIETMRKQDVKSRL